MLRSSLTSERSGPYNVCLVNLLDPGVHFHSGLEDCSANVGEPAELVCKLSSEDCEGVWYKDGEEVRMTTSLGNTGRFHRYMIHT